MVTYKGGKGEAAYIGNLISSKEKLRKDSRAFTQTREVFSGKLAKNPIFPIGLISEEETLGNRVREATKNIFKEAFYQEQGPLTYRQMSDNLNHRKPDWNKNSQEDLESMATVYQASYDESILITVPGTSTYYLNRDLYKD